MCVCISRMAVREWHRLVRMADSQASEAARSLARARWGNAVAVRAAHVVIARAGELPPDVAAEVSAATRCRGQARDIPPGAARLVPADPEV